MDRPQLHERLRQLHQELHQVQLADESKRPVIEQLMAEIEALLKQEKKPEAQRYTRLGEQLRENIELFEASHPRTTLLMGQAIDMLASIGI